MFSSDCTEKKTTGFDFEWFQLENNRRVFKYFQRKNNQLAVFPNVFSEKSTCCEFERSQRKKQRAVDSGFSNEKQRSVISSNFNERITGVNSHFH